MAYLDDAGVTALTSEIKSHADGTYATKCKLSTITISASGWTGDGPYTQSVTITGASASSKIDIQPTPVQVDQLLTDGVKGMLVENNNGVFTVYSIGAVPTVSLNMQITITETTQ